MKLLLVILLFSLNALAFDQQCLINDQSVINVVTHAQQAVDQLTRRPRPSCELDELLNCDFFENNQDEYIDIGGGKIVPNLTFSGRPIMESELTEEERRQTGILFDEVRTSILEEVTRGRSYNELSPYEKIMHDKVSTIQFKGLQECSGSRPNGSYDAIDHSITICPAYMKMPKINLVRVLAHEIAHTVDHCHMQCGFYDRNKEAQVNSGSLPPIVENYSSPYMALSPNSQRKLAPDSDMETALSLGLIRERSNGQAPESYPLLNQFLCLEGRKGKENIVTPGKTECSRGSTAGEDTADIWSARVVGKYLQNNPFSSELERQAFFYQNVAAKCDPKVKRAKKLDTSGGFAHSSDEFRINEIFLVEPNIQRAIGCTPVPKECSAALQP